METVTFKKNVGGKIELAKEQVEEVRQVNGAVTDLIISQGEEKKKIRVKGSYFNAMKKLDREVKPKGLENYDLDPATDKKLKHFVG